MIFFFIKSIFLVIVNKIPHSKKILEILSNSPSPPMWNNWLSHLLNLYSFVINIYFFSSPLLSSNNFFVSSHPFFSFFFTRPHKAKEWRPAAHFNGHISLFRQSFWPESDRINHFGRNWTILTVLAPISAGIGPNQK